MNNVNIRWRATSKIKKHTIQQEISINPLIPYIKTQSSLGTAKKVIFENLMRQGYPYRNIKNAYTLLDKNKKPALDWRSPTSINETARMLRRDIRSRKISYSMAMRFLINARNIEKSKYARSKHTVQLNKEIKITKKLLKNLFANPLMIKAYNN